MRSYNELTGSVSKPLIAGTLLAIVVASFAVYFNALSNGFIFDDVPQVVNNPWIRDFRYLPTIFSTEVWGFKGVGVSNYYRPLIHVAYMIAYHLFGLSTVGFHAINVLVHAGVSVLVFLITFKLLARTGSATPFLPAVLAALMFVVHPIHTEAVTWIAGLTDLSLTFFFLLSFYFYMSCGEGTRRSCIVSAVAFFMATLFKETALTLPILFVVYDYCFSREGESLADRARRYAPYVMVVVLYFVMRVRALGALVPINRHGELGIYQTVINIFPLVAKYLQKLLVPTNLNAIHEFHPSSSLLEPKVMLSLGVMLALGAVLFLSARRAKTVFLGLCFIIVPLLPSLYIRAIPYPFAERYLYLPSFGFVLIVAVFLARMTARPGAVAVLGVIVPAVTGLYAAGTVMRNRVWKNDFTFWSDTVKKSPRDAVSQQNMGNALLGAGDVDGALQHFMIAYDLKPDEETSYAVGFALQKKGLLDRAIEQYQQALKYNPKYTDAMINLGNILLEKGSIDDAIGEYKQALALEPGNPRGRMNLGVAYLKKGLLDQGIEELSLFVRLQPGNPKGHLLLGAAYRDKGLLDKAEEQFALARAVDPRFRPR